MSDALPVVESHLVAGEGWVLSRGRDARTGLPRLVVTLAAADLAEVRRVLAVAGSVGAAHLAEAVDAVSLANGSVAVVFVAPGGPSFADLVGRRSALSAGEVVTLVAPLAGTLAALEARGLRLGEVCAETVWLAGDGRPLLVPIPVGRSGGVAGLAALALRRLDRSSPGADPVGSALGAAVAGRVDGAALAVALLRATPAAPLALDGPAAEVAAKVARRPRRRRLRRRLPVARLRPVAPTAAIAVVALLAVFVGGLWGRHGDGSAVLAAPPVATASPASAAPTWMSVMSRLERSRASAFAKGDVSLLTDVYADGSPQGEADRRLLAGLASRGQRAVGLRAFVEQVGVVEATENRATLRVTDALTAYDVVGRDGRVIRRGHGRPSRQWRVALVKTPAGWRIWSVRPVRSS